jgi:hypothetical protein
MSSLAVHAGAARSACCKACRAAGLLSMLTLIGQVSVLHSAPSSGYELDTRCAAAGLPQTVTDVHWQRALLVLGQPGQRAAQRAKAGSARARCALIALRRQRAEACAAQRRGQRPCERTSGVRQSEQHVTQPR